MAKHPRVPSMSLTTMIIILAVVLFLVFFFSRNKLRQGFSEAHDPCPEKKRWNDTLKQCI
jgi:Sec-independent protein translocase protein TatA